jgi:hypothetical protein
MGSWGSWLGGLLGRLVVVDWGRGCKEGCNEEG